jgi:hypothetical protein
MSTPHEFERAPAPWSAAQAAAVREAAAALRAARQTPKPSVRRIQRPTHPLAGYGVLLGCVLLFGPILTCGGLSLPVLTCAGMVATPAHPRALAALSQRSRAHALEAMDEEESGAKSWYSYRTRDGVTVYGFGVPPFGSTVIDPEQADSPLSVAGPDRAPRVYPGVMSTSRSPGVPRYRLR